MPLLPKADATMTGKVRQKLPGTSCLQWWLAFPIFKAWCSWQAHVLDDACPTWLILEALNIMMCCCKLFWQTACVEHNSCLLSCTSKQRA
jgi:hypothetical protein